MPSGDFANFLKQRGGEATGTNKCRWPEDISAVIRRQAVAVYRRQSIK